jgi:hypothetical protein
MTGHPDGEAAVRSAAGELRFMRGGHLSDRRGSKWSVEGDHAVLELHERDGLIDSRTYPDALARIWEALRCPTSGDVLASARPGYEFLDWGRQHHIGGGSHGALHANDSHAALIWSGTADEGPAARPQWSLRDIVPMTLAHFGLEP